MDIFHLFALDHTKMTSLTVYQDYLSCRDDLDGGEHYHGMQLYWKWYEVVDWNLTAGLLHPFDLAYLKQNDFQLLLEDLPFC